ncbi:hypothetical protein TNCV_4611991 [Trichonephila clavipes]|nr:hypothetical protein TNCV_4611991 [Trichonephila clavipes]
MREEPNTKGLLFIKCLDKQSSVSREERKGEVTSKTFFETVCTCYATGLRKERPVLFVETQCPILTTYPPHASILTCIGGESSAIEQTLK